MKHGGRVVVVKSAWGLVGRTGEIIDVTKDGYLYVELDGGLKWYFHPQEVEVEGENLTGTAA